MFRFPGVALITGAGGTGIGAAVARGFAKAGCSQIAITDLHPTSLASTRDAVLAINPKAQVFSRDGDISSESFVDSVVSEATKQFSRIDYAVSCAGVLGAALKSHETSVADFDRINNINYRGSWLFSRAVLSQMLRQKTPSTKLERGSIVHIASQLGIAARPEAAPYCASKAAIIHMTKSDAIDYSTDGIRVNCVCPGVIATPMTTSTPELIERLRPAIDIAPMKRLGTPEEIANAVLFLASEQASFVQGHALVVDGGYTIN